MHEQSNKTLRIGIALAILTPLILVFIAYAASRQGVKVIGETTDNAKHINYPTVWLNEATGSHEIISEFPSADKIKEYMPQHASAENLLWAYVQSGKSVEEAYVKVMKPVLERRIKKQKDNVYWFVADIKYMIED